MMVCQRKPSTRGVIAFFAAVLSAASFAQTSVITRLHNGVSHFYYTPASTINDVVLEALPNDTIILPGGPIIPNGELLVNKPLTFVGAGIFPDSTIVTGRTVIPYSINTPIRIFVSGSGSRFHGVDFESWVRVSESNVTNLVFSRCEFSTFQLGFTGFTAASNVTFTQCIFRNGLGTGGASIGSQNLLLSNCILIGQLYVDGSNVPATASISQCVLLDQDLSSTTFNAATVYTNCIFTRNASSMVVNHPSTFDHCLFAPLGPSVTFGGGPHPGHQVMAFSGVFVNANVSAFDYTYNYHPIANNATFGNGVAGQNIGLYGPGTMGWKAGAVPFNPHWQQLIPPAATVGGVLQGVQLQGSAQSN